MGDPLKSGLPTTDQVVVLDGGLATELERRGHDLSDDLWSARLLLDQPEEIVAAHLAFFRAGARVATTASYQAGFDGFARRGIGAVEAADLMRRSVVLAGEARDRFLAERPELAGAIRVAASVGPYGAVLADGSEYTGDYGLSDRALRDFHGPRLEVLAGAAPDLLALETLPSVQEGAALLAVLEEVTDVPAWLSYTCADAEHTRRGDDVAEAFALASGSSRVIAVGVNCTAPEHADALVAAAVAHSGKPAVVYPNSGEAWDGGTRTWKDGAGAAGASVGQAQAKAWVAAGARYVGGCCRVSPEQIAAIAGAVGPSAPAG